MCSTTCLSGAFDNRLTTGTMINPASIANAPALIGDCNSTGKDARKKMLAIIRIEPKAKQIKQESFVVRFQYKLNKNGAKKEPASAPHEIPISCAMKVTADLY